MPREIYDDHELTDWISRGRRLTRPAAIFGRGRMLSFIMMAGLGLMSFISRNTEWVRPQISAVGSNFEFGRTAYLPRPNRLANPVGTQGAANYSLPSQIVRTASAAPAGETFQSGYIGTRQMARRNTVPSIATSGMHFVERHGGILEDARAMKIRQVGNRLTSAVRNIPQGSVKFYLLRDDVNPAAYAVADGSILMTSAMYKRMRNDGDIATVLSDRIIQYLYQGVDVSRDARVAEFRGQMLAVAGFDPSVLMQYSSHQANMRANLGY